MAFFRASFSLVRTPLVRTTEASRGSWILFCIPTRTFSSTVWLLKRRTFWKVRLMPFLVMTSEERLLMVSPSKRMVPSVGL